MRVVCIVVGYIYILSLLCIVTMKARHEYIYVCDVSARTHYALLTANLALTHIKSLSLLLLQVKIFVVALQEIRGRDSRATTTYYPVVLEIYGDNYSARKLEVLPYTSTFFFFYILNELRTYSFFLLPFFLA